MVVQSLTVAYDDSIDDERVRPRMLRETLSAISALKGQILVIKLGGSTIEHDRAVLADILRLHRLGLCPVLVHGGGIQINEWLNRLAIPVRFEQGLRVTDRQTLEVVRMVLVGQVNPDLVLLLCQMGGKAIGLSGMDGGMIRARVADERLGLVGVIDQVDPTPVRVMLAQGYIPVIAPLGAGPDGDYLNINADLVAAHLAAALAAERLIFLSDVAGICRADGSLIESLNEAEARHLMYEGVINGGMIPKVLASLSALSHVSQVHIIDGREHHPLLQKLFTSRQVGTTIIRSAL